MLTKPAAAIYVALTAALVAVVASIPPAVHASSPPPPPPPHHGDMCQPYIDSLHLDGDFVALSVDAVDHRLCRRTAWMQMSYGASSSANAYRLRVPDAMRVALRDFRLGGMLHVKVRSITADGAVSYWSAPRQLQLPERPAPPTIEVEPAVYGQTTPWVKVSWRTDAGVDNFEIEAHDADDILIEGDRTRDLSIRYRPNNDTTVMKFRVRSVSDAGHSAWSLWAYARRSD